MNTPSNLEISELPRTIITISVRRIAFQYANWRIILLHGILVVLAATFLALVFQCLNPKEPEYHCMSLLVQTCLFLDINLRGWWCISTCLVGWCYPTPAQGTVNSVASRRLLQLVFDLAGRPDPNHNLADMQSSFKWTRCGPMLSWPKSRLIGFYIWTIILSWQMPADLKTSNSSTQKCAALKTALQDLASMAENSQSNLTFSGWTWVQ